MDLFISIVVLVVRPVNVKELVRIKCKIYSIDSKLQFEYNVFIMILDASLDTSFWTIASQVGVVPYLFGFFRVHYCTAVWREIITTNPDETKLIYQQAMLFQVFEEDGRLFRQEPQLPLRRFGAGEAHAIALALEKNWVLLINDYRSLEFAASLGIKYVSVPGFCALLYGQGKITYSATQGYLARLATTTNRNLLIQARQVVLNIANQRGDKT